MRRSIAAPRGTEARRRPPIHESFTSATRHSIRRKKTRRLHCNVGRSSGSIRLQPQRAGRDTTRGHYSPPSSSSPRSPSVSSPRAPGTPDVRELRRLRRVHQRVQRPFMCQGLQPRRHVDLRRTRRRRRDSIQRLRNRMPDSVRVRPRARVFDLAARTCSCATVSRIAKTASFTLPREGEGRLGSKTDPRRRHVRGAPRRTRSAQSCPEGPRAAHGPLLPHPVRPSRPAQLERRGDVHHEHAAVPSRTSADPRRT